MEHQIKTTFEEFLNRIKEKAQGLGAHNYYDSYEELPKEQKQTIKEKYEAVDQFCFMSQDEYEQQLADYDDGYMGEDAKVGDLMWFDGECLCCESTVNGWFLQSLDEANGCYLDWEQVADLVKELIVLEEFEHYQPLSNPDYDEQIMQKIANESATFRNNLIGLVKDTDNEHPTNEMWLGTLNINGKHTQVKIVVTQEIKNLIDEN